jgi:hypothetical protein
MRDVIASVAESGSDADGGILIDRARSGSKTARTELSDQNIVVGPWGSNPRTGLVWN